MAYIYRTYVLGLAEWSSLPHSSPHSAVLCLAREKGADNKITKTISIPDVTAGMQNTKMTGGWMAGEAASVAGHNMIPLLHY